MTSLFLLVISYLHTEVAKVFTEFMINLLKNKWQLLSLRSQGESNLAFSFFGGTSTSLIFSPCWTRQPDEQRQFSFPLLQLPNAQPSMVGWHSSWFQSSSGKAAMRSFHQQYAPVFAVGWVSSTSP
jgi:hypothetical protein